MKFNLSLVLIFMASVVNAADYFYSGPNFQDAAGVYTTNDRITGTFTTANLLADNLPERTDITSLVESYQFSDGHQVLTESNSTIIQFYIGTDNYGKPTTWAITFWESPVTGTPGDPVNIVETTYTTGPNGLQQDQGSQDAICGEVINGTCSSANSDGTNSGLYLVFAPNQGAGNWRGGRPIIIPTLTTYGLFAMLLLMMAVGFRTLRKVKIQ